jgi:hypothetical protein
MQKPQKKVFRIYSAIAVDVEGVDREDAERAYFNGGWSRMDIREDDITEVEELK